MTENSFWNKLKQAVSVFLQGGDNSAVGSSAGGDIITGSDNTVIKPGGDYVRGDKVTVTPQPDHAHLQTNYLSRLYDQCRRLSMEGIDPQSASENGGELTLDGVYTALLTYQSEPDMLAGRQSPEKQTRLSALDQLNRHKYLVLRGDPGSGKSVFVNYVALCLAGEQLTPLSEAGYLNLQALTAPLPDDEGQDQKQRQPWDQPVLLPIRVILRDFVTSAHFPQNQADADAQALWRFVEADLGDLSAFAPHLKTLVSRQSALLLLDGLDEVPDAGERRQRLKAVILDFKACYPHARILVTSRIYAYQQDQQWQLPEFSVATLAPFSRGQIVRFVTRWYAQTAVLGRRTPEDAGGRAEVLKREIFRNERLYELAESPLLLTLIASLHDWRSGSLPDEREKLYEEAVELLLENWEKRKVKRDSHGKFESLLEPSLSEYLHVTKKAMRGYLEQLAFEAHRDQDEAQSQQTADIPQQKLISGLLGLSSRPDLKPRLLAHYLSRRAGLLPERRAQIHTFPHRTFQEYLAACYLNRDRYPDKVAELARAEPNRWREVTLLAGLRAAGTTESPLWELAEALCQNDPPAGAPSPADMADLWGAHLAAQGLTEAGTVTLPPQQKRHIARLERIRAWLVKIVDGAALPAVERAAAGANLAHLGDPRPGVGLLPPPPPELAEGGRSGEGGRMPDIIWCDVPGGAFLYGNKKQKVELPAFRISKYPVTNAQYSAFVAAGGYSNADYWPVAIKDGVWRDGQFKGNDRQSDYGVPFNLPNHPVVGVSWYEALAYCAWLTEKMANARYNGAGSCELRTVNEQLPAEQQQMWFEVQSQIVNRQFEITLPTEKQWEKAARGTEGHEYPWGAEVDPEKANYEATQIGSTSAVGCFAGGASPYGCEEMSGNVWEWCRTKYSSPEDDGLDEGTSVPRVLRGGAFLGYEGDVRCAIRSNLNPLYRYWSNGFRVVVSPLFDL